MSYDDELQAFRAAKEALRPRVGRPGPASKVEELEAAYATAAYVLAEAVDVTEGGDPA